MLRFVRLWAMRPAGSSESAARLAEPLSHSELRVLRYLPTHLSAPEIASELSVSLSTVTTHMRNLYSKLDGLHPAEYETRCTDEPPPGDPRQGVRHAC